MRLSWFWVVGLCACGGEHGLAPGAGGDAGGAPSTSDAVDRDCAASAEGVEVDSTDLEEEDGYSPYAVDGCRLVFVSPRAGAHGGALVLRDLTSGEEETLAPAEARPRRPTLAGDVVAWEETSDGLPTVRVRAGSVTSAPAGDFHHSVEPRATYDAVVFTGFLSAEADADADVFLYTVASSAVERLASGPGQQRFADISATHVAISDFSVDPGGVYDALGQADSDIVVIERATGERVTRPLEGKQAYPMLGADGRLIYLEWLGVRPVPKLAGYTIRVVELDDLRAAGAFVGEIGTDPPAFRPVARGERIEWVEYHGATAELFRARADGTASPIAISAVAGLDLYAPQAAEAFTVIATTRLADRATLRGIRP